MTFFKFVYLAAAVSLAWPAAAGLMDPEPLAWDAPYQTNIAHVGDVSTRFTFKVKNISTNVVVIDDLKPSCGCTTAQLPTQPWRLAPNEGGQFDALVDLRGKTGRLFKGIEVRSITAPKMLSLTIDIQPGTNTLSKEMADRIWGQQVASTDHQAVFKKDCVKCHLEPAFGKTGPQLYQVACGICHESEHRATMVPDLHTLKTEIDGNYWRNWVTNGKPGTLMPGFAAVEGGPLDDSQITSLVKYLTNAFPRPLKPGAKSNDDDAKD